MLRRSLLHMRRSNVAAAFRVLRVHGAIGAASMGAQLQRSKTRTAASEATSVAWRAASAATDSAATASMVLAIQALALSRIQRRAPSNVASAAAPSQLSQEPAVAWRGEGNGEGVGESAGEGNIAGRARSPPSQVFLEDAQSE